MLTEKPACIHCERTSDEVPLLMIQSQGKEYWICPAHLPILIHQPAKLASKLPGAQNLGSGEGHSHD